MKRILIVGAGFSGTLAAVQLATQLRTLRELSGALVSNTEVILVDPVSLPGRGVAYSTPDLAHLLNVRAANMSAMADEPSHFVQWLQDRYPNQYSPISFVPRGIYGEYLSDLFEGVQNRSSGVVELRYQKARAVRLRYQPAEDASRFVMELDSGECLSAEIVICAIGNLTRHSLSLSNSEPIASAWDYEFVNSIHPDREVLLIGSGLTAVDSILSLARQNHRGQITVLSRRGLLPRPHDLNSRPPFLGIDPLLRPQPLSQRLHEYRAIVARGIDPRDILDAFRPHTQALWGAMSISERKRFIRHLLPYWNVNRHRMAPEVARTLHSLIDRGQVRLLAGRTTRNTSTDDGTEFEIQLRNQEVTRLRVDCVLDCRGGRESYQGEPLLESAAEQGLVVFDELGISPRSIDARFKVLGPVRRGELWECTAVPELRQEVAEIARDVLHLLRSLE